ncbi:hypothetical protein ANAPC1_01435 [Anaplasma phagocytophilum]|uniref:Uncharacterized protein n=2 Tax=Anaplasma phagocytophilum TaxID=948 RepID=A0AA45ZI56_ANAPH|nr:hypothetical protein [Anaplasma phagocytophilum]SBO15057.1 hypothetical protein ANAPC1_01435 [Anaplasma phagocytophilum]
MAKIVKFLTRTTGMFLLLLLCNQGIAVGAEENKEDTSKVI